MRKNDSIKVLHIITGLGIGGAESILIDLLKNMDGRRIDQSVLCLGSPVRRIELDDLDWVNIEYLDLGRGVHDLLSKIRTLRYHIDNHKPDIVQTWMYHADLLGGIAAKLEGIPVVWGLFSGNLEWKYYKIRTVLIIKLCALVSHFVPEFVLSCSHRGIEEHGRIGYSKKRMKYVTTGFDTVRFNQDKFQGTNFRLGLGIGADVFLIGIVARFDPQKDYESFFRAISIFRLEARKFVVLVAGGYGVGDKDNLFSRLIEKHQLKENVVALGYLPDIVGFYNSLDLMVLSTHGEGLPRVIGEAMATGVPCIATDVGDIAKIVGKTGMVVTRSSPEEFSDAIRIMSSLTDDEKQQKGEQARQRIIDEYSIDRMVVEYTAIYEQLILRT
jgi:glycosyltransferase involved in cell wall biosynthesis